MSFAEFSQHAPLPAARHDAHLLARRLHAHRQGPRDGLHPRRDGFHTLMPFENVHGNGGLLTTVGDLLKWNENFVSPVVGDAAFVWPSSRSPGTFNDGRTHGYALGLFVGDSPRRAERLSQRLDRRLPGAPQPLPQRPTPRSQCCATWPQATPRAPPTRCRTYVLTGLSRSRPTTPATPATGHDATANRPNWASWPAAIGAMKRTRSYGGGRERRARPEAPSRRRDRAHRHRARHLPRIDWHRHLPPRRGRQGQRVSIKQDRVWDLRFSRQP